MRRKRSQKKDQGSASGDRRVSPADVQTVEFRLAFRGYHERDVDAFLDRVTEDLASYIDENRRLREANDLPPAALSPDGPLGEAEAAVARAREEAAAIVRNAEARAAALGAGRGDPRAAVAPFLNREREFLQSLGTLVQDHAEEIKRMVLALKAMVGEPAPAVADAYSGEEGTEEEEISEVEAAYEPITVAEAEAPDEPDEAGEETGSVVSRESQRSLRELFWGED